MLTPARALHGEALGSFDAIVVGGGHGGAQAAIALRQNGFAGTIAVIGEEPELPYERPPLSKDYLAAEKPFERLLIRPSSFWDDRAVAMLTGHRVVEVDAVAQRIACAGGERFGYGVLIWATGGKPRRLSCTGHDLAGVHTVRARADVDQLALELDRVETVAVVGGGYVGLEAAAVLRKLGKQVVLIEAQPRVLARVAGEQLSRFYEAQHRAHGVELRLDAAVSCLLEDAERRVSAVRLATGEEIPTQMAIVGIGILPEVAPLADAGATLAAGGVLVDDRCRTSLPGVFAVGDCAAYANDHAEGAVTRVESVQNATDQATVAARTICGHAVHHDALPWFWSNQYDLKLQTVGLSVSHDAVVVRGTPSPAGFSVVYLRDGRVVALDCVNRVKDYVQGRNLILSRVPVAPARLADEAVPLKSLLAEPVATQNAPGAA